MVMQRGSQVGVAVARGVVDGNGELQLQPAGQEIEETGSGRQTDWNKT